MAPKSGIYVITNAANGHQYIGSAANVEKRWKRHLYMLRRGTHYNQHLQSAWNKYGENTFAFAVVCICDMRFLLDIEQRFLNGLHPEYNLAPLTRGGSGPCSSETREKLRVARLGKRMSESTRAALLATHVGIPLSKLRHAALNSAHVGIPLSESHRAAISAAKIGRSLLESTRAAMSVAHKGRHRSAAERAAISKGRKGKHFPRPIKASAASTGEF
jgi:group I intron endonuclease